MITGILNSGFGHSVRFIALTESLRKYTEELLSCLAPQCMKSFLDTNISRYSSHQYNIYTCFDIAKKGKTKHSFTRLEKKLLYDLQATSLVINDFVTQVDNINLLFKVKPILCCLYHGDIFITDNDSTKAALFKNTIIHTANKHHIFFHINIQQPETKPKTNCHYIPIPIVTRQITTDRKTVMHALGLHPDEKFLLVHAGSAVMENVYKDLHDFYSAVNHLKTDFRIVVAGSLENNNFPFHDGIIKAPLFNNGINLINASEMVISKPGMGILQDCIMAKKPLIFLPGDFAERHMKIQMLDSILLGNHPTINKINTQELKSAILECHSLQALYADCYSKIPVNGADVLARCLCVLKNIKPNQLDEVIPWIRKYTPYGFE